MISTKDIAWLAGLLEGEGSFSLHVTTKRYPDYRLPAVQVGMTDEDVIARAAKLLGCKYHKRITQHKPIYTAVLLGKRAAGWMMTLYALMGSRRQQRIQEVLDYWKNQPSRGSPAVVAKWRAAALAQHARRQNDRPIAAPQAT